MEDLIFKRVECGGGVRRVGRTNHFTYRAAEEVAVLSGETVSLALNLEIEAC